MEAPQPVHPDLQLSLLHNIQDESEAYVVGQEDAERIAYYLEKASSVVVCEANCRIFWINFHYQLILHYSIDSHATLSKIWISILCALIISVQ